MNKRIKESKITEIEQGYWIEESEFFNCIVAVKPDVEYYAYDNQGGRWVHIDQISTPYPFQEKELAINAIRERIRYLNESTD